MLLSILDRYILREFVVSSLATAVVLLVIFTGSFFADVVNEVATGRLPGNVMFTVLGLHLVSSLQALLPVGTFVGMLVTLGRMYRDSEIYVLAASGFGPSGLLKPTGIFAVGTTIVLAFVALWLGPLATRTSRADVERANRSVIAVGLAPGRFSSLAGGGGVLFANTVSASGTRLGQLFVEREHTGKNGVTSISVVTAASGNLLQAGAGRNRFITLHDGHRYEIRLGQDNWRMLQFRHGNIALAPPAAALDSDDAENVRSTSDLLRDHHPAARAELQWRLAVAFSPLMLAMLALPLARQAPRASPAGRVLVGVLAYFIIMNMITLARNFIANGQLAAPLGMWWILLPVFAGAAWVFTQQYAVRTLPARKQVIG